MTAIAQPQSPAPRRHRIPFLRRKPLPPGTPGVDRPKLIRDLSKGKRFGVQLVMFAAAAAGGWLGVRLFAGIYHCLLELNATEISIYHTIFHVDWFRHLIVRDASEKSYAGAAVQVIVYNFASHWPRKPASWWDRNIERRLGIANQRLDDQGLIVIFLAPLWLIIYSMPGELGVAGILKLTGQNTLHPPTWQVTIAGLTGSLLMGRRIAKGFAFHMQRLMIRERLQNRATRNQIRQAKGKKWKAAKPAWWMLWPLRWRLQWTVLQRDFQPNRAWKHRRLQIAFHGLVYLAVVGVFVYLTWRGGQLLKTNGI